MDEFCKNCGIKIDKPLLGFFGGMKYYQFEDGIYCEKCAKIKVDNARKKN
jgi:hypothetical protein